MERHLQSLAKHVRKHEGEEFDIQDLFFRLTVDTSMEFLFGECMYGLCDEAIDELPSESFERSSSFLTASRDLKINWRLELGCKIGIG